MNFGRVTVGCLPELVQVRVNRESACRVCTSALFRWCNRVLVCVDTESVCVCGGGGPEVGGVPTTRGTTTAGLGRLASSRAKGKGRWQSHYGHFFQSWYRCAGWGWFGLGANVCHSYTLLWLEASGCCHAACAVHGLIVTNCDCATAAAAALV
jgi:hypothetical protein